MSSLSNGVAPHAIFGYEIHNHFVNDVLVQSRGGMNYIVPGVKEVQFDSGIVLVVKCTIPSTSRFIIDLNGCSNPLDHAILSLIQERIAEENQKPAYQFSTLPIEMKFSITLNNDHAASPNGEIVSDIFGITLTKDMSQANVFVSSTVSGGMNELRDAVEPQTGRDVVVTGVKLVDSSNHFGALWMHVLGAGKQVPVNRNREAPDGLYIYSKVGTAAGKDEFYSLSDLTPERMKALGLYRNKQLADMGGNSKLLQQLESKAEELAANERKTAKTLEDVTTKYVSGLDLMESFKRQIQGLKLEKAMSDERSRLNSEVSKAKHSTSSFSEFIKGLVSVVGVVFTGIKLFC